jgi:hypothetical protein
MGGACSIHTLERKEIYTIGNIGRPRAGTCEHGIGCHERLDIFWNS